MDVRYFLESDVHQRYRLSIQNHERIPVLRIRSPRQAAHPCRNGATAGSCRLALRVPLTTFHKAELKPFATKHTLTIEASDDRWVIDWSLDESENYDRFSEEDGSGWRRRLASLRDEMMRGDLRPLYLGWLAAAANGELGDGALEPEVPPGMQELSRPQQALVEFLEIDRDILAASMRGSARASQDDTAQTDRLDAWLDEWPRTEMTAVLKLIPQDRGHEAERLLRSRHAAWLKAQRPSVASSLRRRSVA